MSALCPIAEACDKFVKDIEEIFHIGQTLTSRVTEVDENTKRVTVSLKASRVLESGRIFFFFFVFFIEFY